MGKHRVMLSILLLGACLICMVPCAKAADEYTTIEDASPQEIVDGMANKLARGTANVATGWLELPKQIAMTSKREGLVKGLTVGPLKGIGMGLFRTVSGVGEALTFFIAYPGFYDPLIDPSYVWDK
jgi:putative exosortase-associated protein (TIGR04073 family)